MNQTIKNIELLAPARNTDFGIAAINHGADALYVGASKFGARNAASNETEDIARLVRYAHLFNVKVYAALNTILYNNEFEEVRKLVFELNDIGIDGLIIQDLGILQLDLPPIPIIASTQTNNITAERVLFFEKLGFKRVILARELSLMQIKEIKKKTNVELESFVHGALCVSYSGQCYMSQSVCNRSANRGVCAQTCRSAYNLENENGDIILKNKHLLSQKDLNLSSHLNELLEAGITSFKIEGRLKDLGYVKNIVSYYRLKLDNLLNNSTNFHRSSIGKHYFYFQPDPEKSFNRGFTTNFIHGRKEKTGEINTQKSIGKRFGYITKVGNDWISVDSEGLVNGDGICFFDRNSNLNGTNVNNILDSRIFVGSTKGMEVGFELYRNHDQAFEKILSGNSADRKVLINMELEFAENKLVLNAITQNGVEISSDIEYVKELAKNVSKAEESIHKQLKRAGDSIFEVSEIKISLKETLFIPISTINELRRQTLLKLQLKLDEIYRPERNVRNQVIINLPKKQLDFSENVSNNFAREFYLKLGVENIQPAFELFTNHVNPKVMTTKYCIKYQLDACKVFNKKAQNLGNTFYLKDLKNSYRLEFDCKNCEMNVIHEIK